MERRRHVVFGEQRIEVQREHRQHTRQNNRQLHPQECHQTARAKVARRILQFLVNGVERRLDHAQGKRQLDHRIRHHNQESHVLAHVQVVVENIPHAVSVEVSAVGVANQDGRQQPREEQAVFQHRAALLALVLEDVVDRNDDDNTRQRRRNRGEDEAQPDAADGIRIGEQTRNRARSRFQLAAVGQELIVLLTEEVNQRELIHRERFGANCRVVLERKENNHHHWGHVDDEQDVGVDMCQHVRNRVANLLLDQLRLRFADGEVMPFALVGGQDGQQDDGEHRQNDGQQRRARLRERFVRRR